MDARARAFLNAMFVGMGIGYLYAVASLGLWVILERLNITNLISFFTAIPKDQVLGEHALVAAFACLITGSILGTWLLVQAVEIWRKR